MRLVRRAGPAEITSHTRRVVVTTWLVTESSQSSNDSTSIVPPAKADQRPLLIVDSDSPERHEIVDAASTKFRPQWATSVDQALVLWRSVEPVLVVLGLELHEGGLELLVEIRRSSAVPVIVISSDAHDESCLLAFQLGADDYVVRPCSAPVLVARINALLRRGGRLSDPVIISNSTGLRIDLGARQVFVRDDEVRLTPMEFDVLALLASQPRQVFSREHLLHAVWESNMDWQSVATVTEHVRRVRQKLGPASGHITTVFGRGYRFDP